MSVWSWSLICLHSCSNWAQQLHTPNLQAALELHTFRCSLGTHQEEQPGHVQAVQRYQILCFNSVFNAWHLLCTLITGDSSHIFSSSYPLAPVHSAVLAALGSNLPISEPEKSKCALEDEMLIKTKRLRTNLKADFEFCLCECLTFDTSIFPLCWAVTSFCGKSEKDTANWSLKGNCKSPSQDSWHKIPSNCRSCCIIKEKDEKTAHQARNWVLAQGES